jgi:hypothetical protein
MAPNNFEQPGYIISAIHADSNALEVLTSCADDRRLRGRSEVPVRQATSTCTYVQPSLHAPPRLDSPLDFALANLNKYDTSWTSVPRILLLVAFAFTIVFTTLIAEFVAASAPVRIEISIICWIGFRGRPNLQHVVTTIGTFDHAPTPPTPPPALALSRSK